MRRLLIISFIWGVCYGQSNPVSLTVQKDLRVQGQTVLGGVAKERDITMTADTIRIKNLDGTGSLLTIDVNGDVVRGSAGAGGVTGLSEDQVLFGKADGTIEQSANFKYTGTELSLSDGTDFMRIGDESIRWDKSGYTAIYRTSGGTNHDMYLPNAQGGANTRLTNDGSGNLSWAQDVVFEGSTDDANETTLTPTDPTADNTVTIQNITGTIPMAVGTPVSLTGQTASIAATTAYTAPVDGYYQVCFNATVTTAATTSCVLGPFQVRYTEAHDNVVKTFPTSSVNFVNQTNRNNTDAAIGGMFMVHAKAGTNIQYIMGYTSSGATAMQYNLEITVIKIR